LLDAFFLGAIVLVCLQQQVETSIDRIEAVCHTFREKVKRAGTENCLKVFYLLNLT
jgi:hypothetical protein